MSATGTNAPSEGFRLSQLIYDTRYRGATIQIVAMFALMLAFAWLINNTIQNLAALGKEFSFSFLWSTAGYDVNQRLLEYTSQSTHGRAAVMGILNTLILAVVGCITATVLGVLAGVGRLSSNWIVARLMSVYVEGFRNVPVLLWIIIVTAVVNESAPEIKDYKVGAQGIVVAQGGGVNNVKALDGGSICHLDGYGPSSDMAKAFSDKEINASYSLVPSVEEGLRQVSTGECEAMSAPRDILGSALADGQGDAKLLRDGFYSSALIITNRGFYFPEVLFSRSRGDVDFGLFNVSKDLLLIIFVIIVSLFISGRIRAWASDKQAVTGVRPKVLLPRLAVTLVPVIVVLFALGFHLGTASLGRFNFEGGTYVRDSFIGLWIALSLYTGAFIAESVRAGIQAVSKGQTEAAFALGMQPGRTISLVVLPQAMRVIVPPLISQYLNLTKNTSLAIAVGYMDATGTLGGITLNQTGKEMETLLLLMAFYLIVSLSISFVMNVYNERTKLKER
ncbi:ABC transporter permease subunit [Paracoccaceae bacterium]|nr:ABC transporter permease subunit [Paracoccaceae bacterium]